MANPYDFTSGALTAFQLSETRDARIAGDKFRDEVLKPYYAGRAAMYDAQKLGIGAEANLKNAQAKSMNTATDRAIRRANRVDPFVDKALGIKPNTGLRDKSGGLGLGDNFMEKPPVGNWYTGDEAGNAFSIGFSKGSGFPLGAENNSSQVEDDSYFADGTRGGLQIRGYKDGRQPVNGLAGPNTLLNGNQPPVENGLDVNQASSTAKPVEKESSEKLVSAIPTLMETNPEGFANMEKNIFNATNKQFQKMIGAFALMDWADERITSEQLRSTSQSLKKMQVENLGGAMQFALAGNEKAAIARFAESGDDRGENIASIKKIQFDNPIPGAAKKTKDTYDGLEITYKDGSSIKLDPRRLLAETVALKEVVDNDYRFSESIRRNDASIYGTEAQNSATAESVLARNQQKELELNRQILNNVSMDLKDDISNQMEVWKLRNKSIDAKLYPEKLDAQQQAMDSTFRPYANIAAINVGIFNNKNVSYSAVKEAVASKQLMYENVDGQRKPLTFEKNGSLYGRHPNGIFVPLQAKPQQ